MKTKYKTQLVEDKYGKRLMYFPNERSGFAVRGIRDIEEIKEWLKLGQEMYGEEFSIRLSIVPYLLEGEILG